MSKYTTEVRFICEQKSGLTESVGFNSIDKVIADSWDKIFTSNFPIFDETYRQTLCSKILKHYYLREICSETVGVWLLWLNEKMNLIMPYYNDLYKTTQLEFNPLWDTDYTIDSSRKVNGTENGQTNDSSDFTRTDNINVNTTNTNYNLFSNTPQGGLTGVDNQEYLTEARKITDENNQSQTGTVNNKGLQTISNDKTLSNTDDYLERVFGKRGGESYSKMILDYRNTLINIDNMIIEELSDLFFKLW